MSKKKKNNAHGLNIWFTLFCRNLKFVVINAFFLQICIPKISEFTKKWFFQVWWHLTPDIWHMTYKICHLTQRGRWTLSQNVRSLLRFECEGVLKFWRKRVTYDNMKMSRARVPIEGQYFLLPISHRKIFFFIFFKDPKLPYESHLSDIFLNPWEN